jgi:hypothetical protein
MLPKNLARLFQFNRQLANVCLMLGLLFAAGCGGGGMSNMMSPQQSAPVGTTTAQFRVGDAAVDRVIAFEVSIASPIVLTPSCGGAKVNVSIGTNRIELSHLSADMEPFAILNVPQGTYSGADITVSNPEVTFLSNAGTPVHLQSNIMQTITVNFNPPLTITSSPVVVDLDVNLANALTIDAGGNIAGFSFTGSSFSITTKAVGVQNQEEDDDGELEDVRGTVTSVNGSNFILTPGQSGAQLTFATDSTTSFKDGITSLASALNQVVRVEGFTKPDGTLFAKEVEGLENQNGAELEGIITQMSGSLLTVTAHDGSGMGMDNSKVGATFTVSISGLSASKFTVDQGNNFSGLTLPSPPNFPFDGTTIHQGQRIEVEATGSVPPASGMITADKVKLEQQTVRGTVANFVAGGNGTATFDLILPADSHLAIISGQTVVHVSKLAGTDNRFGNIANGSSIRVRGLLFWTGTTFNMIARRVIS